MKQAVNEEKIFSESKKGFYCACLTLAGEILLLSVFAVFAIALTIAVLLILAAIYLAPLQFFVFNTDLSPAISNLLEYQWFIVGLAITALVIIWSLCKNNQKEQAERRLANKILADKGLEPLDEGTWWA